MAVPVCGKRHWEDEDMRNTTQHSKHTVGISLSLAPAVVVVKRQFVCEYYENSSIHRHIIIHTLIAGSQHEPPRETKLQLLI